MNNFVEQISLDTRRMFCPIRDCTTSWEFAAPATISSGTVEWDSYYERELWKHVEMDHVLITVGKARVNKDAAVREAMRTGVSEGQRLTRDLVAEGVRDYFSRMIGRMGEPL